MKKQTIIIGTIVILSLLTIFNYSNGVFPEIHSRSIEENNVTLTQETKLVESRYEISMTEDGEHTYPIMRPDHNGMTQWIEQYNNAPKAIIDKELETRIKATLGGDNFSLLSHLEYIPSERNQGRCGNCWVWAGTGCLGIALDVQENIKNRLSIQYLNSNFNDGDGHWACCGGLPEDFTEFYNTTKKTIPWSNTNASWQDGDRRCNDDTMVPADTISIVPDYPIDSIADETITTHNVSNGTAIDNIKNILNQNKAVWFSFYLPNRSDWTNFFDFWANQGENVTWNPDYSCGDMWDPGSGGGHAVLCVGYNDEDANNKYWIMLNSWGASTGRPNGLFHLDMDMKYDCYFYRPYLVRYYSFYWQTINVSFNIEIPEIVTNMPTNVGETNVTLSGTLLNNGSCDTTCYFLWNTTNNFESPMGNKSLDIIVDGASFSHNISDLSEGQMYFFKTIANNSNGWNTWSNIESFLTKPAPLISFNADMVNSSEIVLTWTNGEGGRGAYIEYAMGSQPNSWNLGDGTPVDTDGHITSPFNHTNLSPNTRYYYKAWAYAEDEGWKSNGSTIAPFGDNPQVQNNKTNALPIITSESPSDNSIEIDNMQPTVSVTIEDIDGDNINWTICGINIYQNSSNNDKNGSKSANLDIPLPYDTNVIWYVNVTDGHDWTNATYNFTVRNRYDPSIPTLFTATTYNRTQINLTWSKGTNADRTYIECNTVPSWDRGSGIGLYNGTGTNYQHIGLSFGTTYYYQAWSWNDTDSCWSTTSSSASNTTDVNSAPSFGVPTPANGSSSQDSAFVWNIPITDADSNMFNWTIECSNGDSSDANDDSNGIKQLSINDLCFNTGYTIWVNVTDGYNWAREWFTFATRAQDVPDAPSGFTAVTKNSTQIDLLWAKGTRADYTRIQRKTGSYPMSIHDGINVYNGTGVSCSDVLLIEGTSYYYCAWSWNQTDNTWSAGNSSVSNTTNNIPTITSEGPSSDSTSVDLTPTLNITVNNLDGDRMTLTWYSNSSGSWQLFGTNTSCVNGTYHQINSNFSNTSTTYYWDVTVNDGLDTSISVTYCFTTRDRYIPESPGSFTVITYNRTQINLTWSKGTNTDRTYIEYNMVQNWDRGGGIGLYNGTGTGYQHIGLSFGTTYYYQAWSWNDTDSCWSTISGSDSNITDVNSAPFLNAETPVNGSTIQQRWPACNITILDTNNDIITVYFYEDTTGSWVLQQTNTSVASGTSVVWNNFTNVSSFSMVYNWSVNATDGYSWTNETYNFTTRDQYIPESPGDFTASADGQSRIVLTWVKGVKTDKTYIRYKSGETSPVNRSDGTELGNYTGEGAHVALLDPGTKYSFKAWSWNDTDNCWSISASNSCVTTETGKKNPPSVPPSQPSEENSNKVNSTKEKIERLYNITLEENFSAIDTDGNGVVDTFIDPNGILKAERLTSINGNISFLISVNGRLDELFIWDVKTDAILEVTYSLGAVIGVLVDVQNDSVIVTINIVKSNWTYMEIKDRYQYLPNLTVKTPDGKNIPTDKIWRENGSIYVLDDPSIEYQLIYDYIMLAPTFNPANKTIFNIPNPTIFITYNESVTVAKATLNNKLINLSTADNKTFIYMPIANMANGVYNLDITAQDAGNNSRDDNIIFTINVEKSIESQDAVFEGRFSWVELFAIIMFVMILMVIFLFKFLVSNQEK